MSPSSIRRRLFKMARCRANIVSAWADLLKHIKLDPPTPFHDSVYLGDSQKNAVVDSNTAGECQRFLRITAKRTLKLHGHIMLAATLCFPLLQ